MYRRFRVKNFRGISELAVEAFGDVTLVTGLNDTGKTSLLEALFVHASGPLAGVNAAQQLRSVRHQGGFSAGGPGPWSTLFRHLESRTPIELTGEWGATSYALTLESDASSSVVGATAGSATNGNGASASSGVVITETRDGQRPATYRQSLDVRAGGQQVPGLLDVQLTMRLDPPVNEPFVRATLIKDTAGADLVAAYSELRQHAKGVDLVAALKVVDPRIVGVEVLLSEGRPELHVQLGRDALIPFSLMGDGVAAMAQYVLAMVSSSGGVLLIDEVGAGIHHSALTAMWTTLVGAAGRFQVQIIATTHSDECLRAAREALAGTRTTLQVVRIDRGRDDSATATLFDQGLMSAALSMGAELR